MLVVAATPSRSQSRPPIWRNAAIIKWGAQMLALALLVGLVYVLGTQAASNLNAKSISVGWDFLTDPPGIKISEGIDTEPATGGRALYVGMVNMLRMSAAAIFAATILGVIIGVARLSTNWIVNKVASVYIETLRNVPLLVIILFILILLVALPRLTLESGPIPGWLYVTNKGISFPWIFPWTGFYQWLVVLALGAVAAKFVHRWRMGIQNSTGAPSFALSWAMGTMVVFAIVGWFIHPLFGFFGPIWGAIAGVIDGIPTIVLQLVLAVAIAGIAANWIRNFYNSFRSPAGMAKINDDDWFRMIFAAVVALLGVALVLLRPGIAGFMLDASRDFFRVAESKFEFGRTGSPLNPNRPSLFTPGRFPQYDKTGMTLSTGGAAIFLGVTLYTAAFIAETIRGGILAVHKGQNEAANALGLKRSQVLRLVVLPQALRIVLPPIGNQYLNAAKNTSLGFAVAYPDLVGVGTTILNQSGQALPVILIWMAFYLSVSLTLSAIVNYFNRRLAIVER